MQELGLAVPYNEDEGTPIHLKPLGPAIYPGLGNKTRFSTPERAGSNTITAAINDLYPSSMDRKLRVLPRRVECLRPGHVTIGFRSLTGKLNLRGRDNDNWGK